jgi:hypothetical protein
MHGGEGAASEGVISEGFIAEIGEIIVLTR